MEALLVTRISVNELLLGKLIPISSSAWAG